MKYSYGEIVWTLKDNGKLNSLYKVMDYNPDTEVYTLGSVFDISIVFCVEEYMKKSIYLTEEDCK